MQKTNSELWDIFKLHSGRGYHGPGTFGCGHSTCQIQEKATASAVVEYGKDTDGDILKYYPMKRLTCFTSGVVYLLHCEDCKKNDEYSIYVGSTADNLSRRIAGHKSIVPIHFPNGPLSNATLVESFIVAAKHAIENNNDVNDIRRSTYVHWHFEHENDFEGLQFTGIAQNSDVGIRRDLEAQAKRKLNAINCYSMGRGALTSPTS